MKDKTKLIITVKSHNDINFEKIIEIKYDESIKNIITSLQLSGVDITIAYNRHNKQLPEQMTVRGNLLFYKDKNVLQSNL